MNQPTETQSASNLPLHSTYTRTAKPTKDQLILNNIDFVGRILSTMSFFVEDPEAKENLHSAGVLGLVEAANKYDHSEPCSFRTFAFPRIRGAIIDELRKQSPVSQQLLRQIGVVQRVYENIEPPVTPEKLAKLTGLTIDQIISCLEAMRFIKPDFWNDLSDVVHGSWRSSPNDPGYQAETEELLEVLTDAITTLPDRERLVLTLYHLEELNLAEIGEVTDLSVSRVSRILATARFRVQEIIRCKTK